MAKGDKVPEWKTINDARSRAESELRLKLRAARLERDSALPPVPVVQKQVKKKAAAPQ